MRLRDYLAFSDKELNKKYCRSLHTCEWFPEENKLLKFPSIFGANYLHEQDKGFPKVPRDALLPCPPTIHRRCGLAGGWHSAARGAAPTCHVRCARVLTGAIPRGGPAGSSSSSAPASARASPSSTATCAARTPSPCRSRVRPRLRSPRPRAVPPRCAIPRRERGVHADQDRVNEGASRERRRGHDFPAPAGIKRFVLFPPSDAEFLCTPRARAHARAARAGTRALSPGGAFRGTRRRAHT